jgi:pilus assembly protein CpaF
MITLQVSIEDSRTNVLRELQITELPVTIGSKLPADIHLKSWRISGKHCTLGRAEHQLVVHAINEARCAVNDRVFNDACTIDKQDVLTIGPYSLRFDWEEPHGHQQPSHMMTAVSEAQQHPLPASQSLPSPLYLTWQNQYRQALLDTFDLKRNDIDHLDDHALRQRARTQLESLISQQADLPTGINQQQFINDIVAEVVGLGPIEALIRNPEVTEIMVNGPDNIFYEQRGKLSKSNVTFSNVDALMAAIERIVQPLGRRIDESSPMVDARLPDGSRVNAVIPPLSLSGPSLTIRKFSQERLGINDLVAFNAVSQDMGAFLQAIVRYKSNIIISGGTGSGKTTLLNILSTFIPDHERIITIEDAAELMLHQPNLVSLESRPSNAEGKGQIAIRDLVRNSLRMRPDRIVIGECRGGEALDMLQAMNTGHAGSLSTAHANTPRDCLSRIEIMVMMSGMEIPISAIREQAASAIDFIIQQTRFPCGQRKITSITEVGGLEQGVIQLTEIFNFETTGFSELGVVQGRFSATGIIPDFIEHQRKQGLNPDTALFSRDLP